MGSGSKLAFSCVKPALLPFVLIWFSRGVAEGYTAPEEQEAECWWYANSNVTLLTALTAVHCVMVTC